MKIIIPQGFKAGAVASGIKKREKLDLALIFSQVPSKAAAMFTTNNFPAAPVKVCREHLNKGRSQAVIVNSGNANSFTGQAGIKDARATAALLAANLGIKKEGVLVASTGIIGKRLPMDKIKAGVPLLVKGLSAAGIHKAARAIMTTDTFPKLAGAEFTCGGKKITVTGMTKGAGMIAPNMATMLCFIMTDARIESGALKAGLRAAVNASFNCITIDGCMSTNDMVLAMANGCAENPAIKAGSASFKKFQHALSSVCLLLAKMMVIDGEGATKFIEIKVKGARNDAQAKKAALAVANSNLVKTAIYGENPNWGRIVCAIGASGVEVKEETLKVKFSPLAKKDIFIEADLNIGKGEAVTYTSDLTPEYIKINAEYN
jgi:glutamate N-acetyltransferase/amino-acid N-acetyltransferase